jgi:aspartyl-tRNA synthetase
MFRVWRAVRAVRAVRASRALSAPTRTLPITSHSFPSSAALPSLFPAVFSTSTQQQPAQPSAQPPAQPSTFTPLHQRTHYCGEVGLEHVGVEATLTGWLAFVRNVGKNLSFLGLRDHTGIIQVVCAGDNAKLVRSLPLESVLSLGGRVAARGKDAQNASMKTGMIEFQAESVALLNGSGVLPFPIVPQPGAGDERDGEMRMRHRYLDLRQDKYQNNLRLRAKLAHTAREYLTRQRFVEIETPTLFKTTAEGAREFIVPTRQPGKFYALPQSPQQFKQLLMVGGLDRYFQIARCWRDESGRADRQPEFTQIDIECSFALQEDILNLIEALTVELWRTAGFTLERPFKRRTFDQVMQRFGSDKPDTRFGMELHDVSAIVSPLQSGFCAKAINVQHLAPHLTAEHFAEAARAAGHTDELVHVSIASDGSWQGEHAARFTQQQRLQLEAELQLKAGDVMLLGHGPLLATCERMGRLRLNFASLQEKHGFLTRDAKRFDVMWVLDFPLFSVEDGVLQSTHNPFTAPQPAHMHLLDEAANAPDAAAASEALLRIKAQHYDLVVNGYEIAGGSIRIHNTAMQKQVLELLSLPEFKIRRFQHLLDALSQGAPPHGGIALGFDRVVAILCQAENIREVIAFPKATSGYDFMSDAPTSMSNDELLPYHLRQTQSEVK